MVVVPLLFLTGYAAAASVADVLVVGGSGRVGASTVRWLDKLSRRNGTPLTIAVGGRDAASFERTRARLAQQGMVGAGELSFAPIDLDGGAAALSAAVAGASLVVHTAGPFQGREEPSLLRAALGAGVPYCDVCDELLLTRNSKALSAEAAAAGVPCVVSCGIWPGVSALMAAEAVAKLGGPGSCERLEFSFHTAGTGGAGPTIVSATFLLLATEAMVYVDGKLVAKEPWTERRVSDFGPGIGERECFLLDNPDVPTSAEALGVDSCSSSFGTYPTVWNGLFGAMKVLPRSLLYNKDAMQGLAIFSMPIIRAVDALVGSANAMRVDAWGKGDAAGKKVTLRCVHPDLEDCVGQSTAAFGMELLRGRGGGGGGGGDGSAEPTVAPGVWFPADLPGPARANILRVACEGASVWDGLPTPL